MTEQHESALAGVLDLAASDELRAAAQHMGRLIESVSCSRAP
jgi:hypothetical protein